MKRWQANILLLYVSLWLLGLSHKSDITPQSALYQLQKLTVEDLYREPFRIAIIDPQDCHNCNKKTLAKLQQHRKIILAYLSIGEAEVYRPYFIESWKTNPPAFLDEENPNWQGNYKVRFWDKNWQAIIKKQLDHIIQEGYDGVYLDIVDGYYFYEQKGHIEAKQLMIDWIIHLSSYAKAKKTGFKIFPQNAEELLTEPRYLQAIDGIGREDVWFDGNKANNAVTIANTLSYLNLAKSAKKTVIIVDYPSLHHLQCQVIHRAYKEDFIPIIARRALDNRLTPHCPK